MVITGTKGRAKCTLGVRYVEQYGSFTTSGARRISVVKYASTPRSSL